MQLICSAPSRQTRDRRRLHSCRGDVLPYIIDPNLKMLGFHAYSPEPIKKHEAKNRHTKPGHGMPVRREVVRLKFLPLWLGLGLANPNPNPSPNPNPAHAR